jgi:hypothetical protein
MLAYVVLVSRVVDLVSVKLLRIDRFRFSLIALIIYKRQESRLALENSLNIFNFESLILEIIIAWGNFLKITCIIADKSKILCFSKRTLLNFVSNYLG